MIFRSLFDRFQLKFKNREAAGSLIGESLKSMIKKHERKNCIVLGIPNGGVITGWAIARKLSCNYGLIIPRKLRAPNNEELSIGAITDNETTYLNRAVIQNLKISSNYIEKEKKHQLEVIKNRQQLFSGSKILNWKDLDLSKTTVIVADDGAASGSTMIASVRSIRGDTNPLRILVALPVIPVSTLALLKKEQIYHIEVITSPPDNKFRFVEQYYQDFKQLSDDQVIEFVKKII